MPLYKPHSVQVHTDAQLSAVIVPDVTNIGVDLSPKMVAELTAAFVSPTHVAMVGRAVKGMFASFALPTLLDSLGVRGIPIATQSNPGVRVFYQKFDDNGEPVAGTVHRSYLYQGGVVVPKTISVDHQGDAKLTVEIVPVKKGTNAIVVEADNAALPSVTIASGRWTMGAIRIGNLALTEYTTLEIDFGNNPETRGVESLVDVTHIEQRTHVPTIKITGIDPTWFAAARIPLGGIAVLNANDYVYLRKRTQDGNSFVANGTAEHIKFSLAGLAAVDKAAGAEAQRASETSLTITLARDASGNSPLIVNTASTHP